MVDINEIVLEEQEFNENYYKFFDVPIVYTPSFREALGEDYELVIRYSLLKIKEKYPMKNYDYLQVFSYRGIKYWVISDAHQNEKWEDEHITFLLPSDY